MIPSKFSTIQSRILQLNEAKKMVATWRLKSDKIVFTNGCFDILHKGHVTYLAQAAEHGNRLIIGLNSDASVKNQEKGSNRPINNQDARALVLASLHFVDAVVIFDEATPQAIIEAIAPDVLVKGGDYDENCTNSADKKYIVGSELVKQKGGKIITIPLVEGFSTTGIIEKMKS